MNEEKQRNQLLRRVDWRFLLPCPTPTVGICFAGGSLATAVRQICQRMADPRHGVHEECDLAVSINPSHSTLLAAREALQPNGCCYVEWYTPFAGGADGIRRRMEAAGFDHVTCYWSWPWPSLACAHLWLPLEAPGALHHFLTRGPAAQGAIRRAGRAIRRQVWLLAAWAGLALPICVIARKRTDPEHDPNSPCESTGSVRRRPRLNAVMNSDLVATVQTEWTSWGMGPTPSQLSWFLLTGGFRSSNKIVALLFAEPNPRPQLVIKLPRVPESSPALANEASILRTLHSLRPGGIVGAPRLLFWREHGGVMTLGETAVTGAALFTRVRRTTYRSLALRATAWQAALGGRPVPSPRAAWWGRLVEPVLTEIHECFGAVLDRGKLDETRAILASIDGLPLVCEQRDFSPWNVLITESGALGVLDWESAEIQGLPALDLIYFLTYLAFFLDGAIGSGRFQQSYHASLDPTTLTGRVRSECLAHYAELVGLQPDALYPLRLIVWLLHARSEYSRFVADAGGRPTPATLRRSLFIGLWEEELRHGL